jgi:hypothetical protein
LALDGGGLRGILTLGILARVESILRKRHGDEDGLRLCHYFDLIAGTSTGAIIAAALARGMTVAEVLAHYQRLGREVFKKSWFRWGLSRPSYDDRPLTRHLKDIFGKTATLGDGSLQTGLLIVTKRLDTGSPWPLGNNPRGRYHRAGPGDDWISNADYPLWKVVRASTAAPRYFAPERITIARQPGKRDVVGTFVDGGVSPNNNPALQAFLYATLDGYQVKWATGADKLLLVSVGTGLSDPSQRPSRFAAPGAVTALVSLMDDCAALVETMMQGLSASPTARTLDREVGDLRGEQLAGRPQLSYLRYNASLAAANVDAACPGLPPRQVQSLGEMDRPANLDVLYQIGAATAARQVVEEHFAPTFDLESQGPPSA